MPKALIDAITEMREEDALRLAEGMLTSGGDPLDILEAGRRAMEDVGQRFEAGEYFVPELIMAGELLRQLSDMAKPYLVGRGSAPVKLGRVVIGTVEGDIHNIGKDIVCFMLDANGFEVENLGENVPPARFVEAVKRFGPQVVGLSGFLTLAYDPMKKSVEGLAAAGLRDKVKIMIGGGQVDEQVRRYTGADAYGKDAIAAVKLAKAWIGA